MQPAPLVAEVAAASSVETAAAIDRPAEQNDDPEVGSMLEDAALNADATVSRTGWLRGCMNRMFQRAA